MPLRLQVWSAKCWGRRERIAELLELLETVDRGELRPDRWNEQEPLRYDYRGAQGKILDILTRERPTGTGRIVESVFVKRKRPPMEGKVQVWRSARPWMNNLNLELDRKTYCTVDGSRRVADILKRFVHWGSAVYALAHPTGVPHARWVSHTPAERLEQIGWLNFFGQPYLDMFGEARLRAAPWHSVEELEGLGLLCRAAPDLTSPQIVETADQLLAIEGHLGREAFAQNGFPSVPCRVPQFDLSDLICKPAVS